MTDVTMDRGSSFRVGNVFSRAWTVLAGNFIFFVGIVVLVFAGMALVIGVVVGWGLLGYSRTGSLPPSFVIAITPAAIIALSLNMIAQAAILFGAFQYLRGQPVRMGEALKTGFVRFLPLVGVGIVSVFGIAFGALLLIVPGLILMTMWAVAGPACVVEGVGPISALSRSAKLTKGHRWQIFGIMVLLDIASGVVNKVLELVLTPAGGVVQGIGSLVWLVIWTAYWNCVVVMAYHDLRVAKEGIDTDQIAAVFD